MESIPQTLIPFFQEYDFRELNPERDSHTIIERVLQYGNRSELRWLFKVGWCKPMSENAQPCPICHQTVPWSPRYTRYLCPDCARKATSKDGRLLGFGNESFSGGYVAWYKDTDEPYLSHECYVDGILCHADEHHMGGIVIQPII